MFEFPENSSNNESRWREQEDAFRMEVSAKRELGSVKLTLPEIIEAARNWADGEQAQRDVDMEELAKRFMAVLKMFGMETNFAVWPVAAKLLEIEQMEITRVSTLEVLNRIADALEKRV